MDPDTIELLYEKLGFEIASIDDMDTLFLEIEENGDYATVTNDYGLFPESVDEAIVFSVYNDDDSFQWSVTLPSSLDLEEVFTQADDLTDVLETLKSIRQENIEQYNRDALEQE